MLYRASEFCNWLFSTSKAAVIAFARSCAQAFAPDVRVNCLAPGLIETDMTAANTQSIANPPSPFRPDDDRATPIIVQDTNVAQPDTVRKACAHRLDGRFLACKAHCEEPHRLLAATK